MTALLDLLSSAGAIVAGVPEPFLDARRYGHPTEVTISGMAVMVIPSPRQPGHRAAAGDPHAEVEAWEKVRDVHDEISEWIRRHPGSIPAGRVERAVDLPDGVVALGWVDGDHEIVCVPGSPAQPRTRHLQVVTS